MKQELKKHLLPLLAIFLGVSLFWLFQKAPWYQFIFLFFGLLWGSFFLDIDHLLYWLIFKPDLEESHLAQVAWKKGDFLSLLKLLESTHQDHTSLVFHHYFFQIILALISFFVFTSSSGVFSKALLLSLNFHLLVDEYSDFTKDPEHLKLWLFARENKQLPTESLKYYLWIFAVLNFIFVALLITAL